ncbi:P-loop containing nucleoside triphosphate hydrolase protein [Pelagophyceae sp. CCMP2097]|nr:P-loop containing nucleoside triphosphate hydrolase protein [Pelagophyceae sp. CCMP2097]
MREAMRRVVTVARRWQSTHISMTRNIGISAHIDSGKTTLTERILFYTGRIKDIHDVRGKDGVGAKMDSMELEREKGITIQSAATFCTWGENHINIIDTPGHVDFTIEVERALRVLDGGVLVLCGVSGVQSQSLTVDRQMKRYEVPRVAFVNKLDRAGADPWRVIRMIRKQMSLNAAAVQIPMGLESAYEGIVDIVDMRSITFDGPKGEVVVYGDIPDKFKAQVEEKRAELVERLAEADDDIAELYLEGEAISSEVLKVAIRKATIARKFVPVFMGSAYKNKGVQPLLDGVVAYLPAPNERSATALDMGNREAHVTVNCEDPGPLLALAFKLEESRFGQLTYVRIYRGALKKGDMITNVRTRKSVKISRLVRMHSNDMEEITEAMPGDVACLFGVDCHSMDSFTSDPTCRLAMQSMFVPRPVISLSIAPKKGSAPNVMDSFGKAIQRFTKEDPTLRVHLDPESKQTIISGMGELHLEVYVERMKREYAVECDVGNPSVSYREAVNVRADFDYLHKKQTGGSGQYARVAGYIEPLPELEYEEDEEGNVVKRAEPFEFINEMIGIVIPAEYIQSVEKGARDACAKGQLIGFPVEGIRVVLTDGTAHAVDSSDMAFRTAAQFAVRQAIDKARPSILEPIMALEVTAPSEFQGDVIGGLNQRRGLITSSETSEDASSITISADVPLAVMFGYSTVIRSATQGKGEFSMEYQRHQEVIKSDQADLIKEYQRKQAEQIASKK